MQFATAGLATFKLIAILSPPVDVVVIEDQGGYARWMHKYRSNDVDRAHGVIAFAFIFKICSG